MHQNKQEHSNVQSSVCSECYPNQPPCWSEEPMNEAIRAYARSYVLPPVEYFFTLDEAMANMGIEITDEDRLLP